MSYYIIITIFGLVIGSFLNVIILRFDDIKSILKTRSHCMHCKKELAWYDLVPFFSYILLAGKCRYCKQNISLQYPIVEILTALIFALLYWKFGLTLQAGFLAAISCLLIIAMVYDFLHYEISDTVVWLGIILWVIWLAISYFAFHTSYLVLLNSLYGGLALGGFLALLVIVSREKWMGAGDIPLGFLLGAIIFWPNVLLSSFLSFFIGSLVGLILVGFKLKGMKDKIPFAPFLIIATFITLFFGDTIIDYYLKLIGA